MLLQVYKSTLCLVAFFFALFSLPKEQEQKLRAKTVGALAPSWGKVRGSKTASSETLAFSLQQLQIENKRLQAEVEQLRALVLWEKQVDALQKEEPKSYEERRLKYLLSRIDKEREALPAHVIFRPTDPWSHHLWLSVGEKDNRALSRTIVAKNSPVLVGHVAVGLVEQVEESRCLVRLITDGSMAVSVRSVRGEMQTRALKSQIDNLAEQFNLLSAEELVAPLLQLKEKLSSHETNVYLAKGTLKGASHSKWRGRSLTLRGVGFNYDFEDEEGKARNLRTGELLEVGDLLVTTGMDGVFPADLPVATVSKILNLHEGGCSYSIEAVSLVSDLEEVSQFFILPSAS